MPSNSPVVSAASLEHMHHSPATRLGTTGYLIGILLALGGTLLLPEIFRLIANLELSLQNSGLLVFGTALTGLAFSLWLYVQGWKTPWITGLAILAWAGACCFVNAELLGDTPSQLVERLSEQRDWDDMLEHEVELVMRKARIIFFCILGLTGTAFESHLCWTLVALSILQWTGLTVIFFGPFAAYLWDLKSPQILLCFGLACRSVAEAVLWKSPGTTNIPLRVTEWFGTLGMYIALWAMQVDTTFFLFWSNDDLQAIHFFKQIGLPTVALVFALNAKPMLSVNDLRFAQVFGGLGAFTLLCTWIFEYGITRVGIGSVCAAGLLGVGYSGRLGISRPSQKMVKQE